jgi:hypothetical protein
MKTELPPILEAKLADFRKRVWLVKILEGVLTGIVGVYASWLMLFVLDRASGRSTARHRRTGTA